MPVSHVQPNCRNLLVNPGVALKSIKVSKCVSLLEDKMWSE